MESAAHRRAAFAVIVFALVGLGAYLIGSVRHGDQPATSPSAASHSSPPTRRAAGTGTGAGSPSPAASAPTSSPPDIYQWLPFTQAGLTAAATTVERFGTDYGTYSYTQDPGQYVAPMRSLASAAVISQIEAAYATPGVTSARTSGKQIAAGSATIESLQAFGSDSLTFTVQVSQQITASTGHSRLSNAYAVTLTGNGTNWQVTAVELTSVGNS
ncbi:MAG TPA: hypothetical protein VGI58_00670 [Streptosporangiaceae bacterium]|jgi:hypothetical protein